MSASPVFASVGHNGTIILNNASGTSVSASIITGVAAGTRIKEIRVFSGPTTAPGTGILGLLYDDGSNQCVLDYITLANTVSLLQGVLRYDSLILSGTGVSIKAIMRTAITSGGTVTIVVEGEDLT